MAEHRGSNVEGCGPFNGSALLPSLPPSLSPSSRANASLTAHTQHHKLCECVARHRRRVLAPYVHHQAHMSGVQRPDSRVTAPLDMQSQETHVEPNRTIFCTERAVFVPHDGGMTGKKRDSLSGAECARARERDEHKASGVGTTRSLYRLRRGARTSCRRHSTRAAPAEHLLYQVTV